MMRLSLLLFMLLTSGVVFSQTGKVSSPKIEFKEIVNEIAKYNDRARLYWEKGETEKADKCRDSLNTLIQKTYLSNYNFETISGSVYKMSSRKKPLFIQVTASWCKPCRFEVTALNRIVEKYQGEVDFVLLFWDTKPELEKIAKEYDNRIYLVPSTKEQNESGGLEISGFKHTMGFPCNYLVALNNGLTGFSQGAMMPVDMIDDNGKPLKVTAEEADQKNYKRLESEILELINK